jgi:hypothetical protein
MKLSAIIFLASLFASSYASDDGCKEKTDTCVNRVKVLATDLVYGLKDDVPVEVIEAFVTASSQCLACVDSSDVEAKTETADESVLSYNECMWYCWCCTEFWCQDWEGNNFCPEQCYDDFATCAPSERRVLFGEDETTADPTFMNFEIDVCMDDMTPLDGSQSSYVDYDRMLDDFLDELTACYADRDAFMTTWSDLCSESGIDLSLMARASGARGTDTIILGAPGLDTEHAEVTTYSSDDSHRSSSLMIFYSALGFVALSAFAVVGTAVVVKVLNKRKEEEAAQEAQWVSEMTAADTSNPVNAAL